MTCNKCEIIQDNELTTFRNIHYFKFKNSNLIILGCKEHINDFIVFISRVNRRDKK